MHQKREKKLIKRKNESTFFREGERLNEKKIQFQYSIKTVIINITSINIISVITEDFI